MSSPYIAYPQSQNCCGSTSKNRILINSSLFGLLYFYYNNAHLCICFLFLNLSTPPPSVFRQIAYASRSLLPAAPKSCRRSRHHTEPALPIYLRISHQNN